MKISQDRFQKILMEEVYAAFKRHNLLKEEAEVSDASAEGEGNADASGDDKKFAFILQPQYAEFVKRACIFVAWKGLSYDYRIGKDIASDVMSEYDKVCKFRNAIAEVRTKGNNDKAKLDAVRRKYSEISSHEKEGMDMFKEFMAEGGKFVATYIGSLVSRKDGEGDDVAARMNKSKLRQHAAAVAALYGKSDGVVSDRDIKIGAIYTVRDYFKWKETGKASGMGLNSRMSGSIGKPEMSEDDKQIESFTKMLEKATSVIENGVSALRQKKWALGAKKRNLAVASPEEKEAIMSSMEEFKSEIQELSTQLEEQYKTFAQYMSMKFKIVSKPELFTDYFTEIYLNGAGTTRANELKEQLIEEVRTSLAMDKLRQSQTDFENRKMNEKKERDERTLANGNREAELIRENVMQKLWEIVVFLDRYNKESSFEKCNPVVNKEYSKSMRRIKELNKLVKKAHETATACFMDMNGYYNDEGDYFYGNGSHTPRAPKEEITDEF